MELESQTKQEPWGSESRRTDPSAAHRLAQLRVRAEQGQWDAELALDWQALLKFEEVRLSGPLLTPRLKQDWDGLAPSQRAALVRFCVGELLTNLACGEQFVDTTAQALERSHVPDVIRPLLHLQAQDEARHERVLLRYVREKLGEQVLPRRFVVAERLPSEANPQKLGWQAMLAVLLVLEISALAAIQGLRTYCDEPLCGQLLRKIVSDESRHISSLVAALRLPEAQDPAVQAAVEDAVVLGWRQGLQVTEVPTRAVAQALEERVYPAEAGASSSPPTLENAADWNFYRQHIAQTLLPKLALCGLLDASLMQRLRDAGCPV